MTDKDITTIKSITKTFEKRTVKSGTAKIRIESAVFLGQAVVIQSHQGIGMRYDYLCWPHVFNLA